MKKNRMMRLASILLVLVLMTSSVVGGTFAKYTTSVNDSDNARVAKWGFEPADIVLDNLFRNAYVNEYVEYDNTAKRVSSEDETDVIAPGTTGSASFAFNFDETNGIMAPEVDYNFVISADGSVCHDDIQDNDHIQWQLDGGTWGTWSALIDAIEALDEDEFYEANTLPTAFNTEGEMHTIAWRWVFDESAEGSVGNLDEDDTDLGNADVLAGVTIKITVTATQVD